MGEEGSLPKIPTEKAHPDRQRLTCAAQSLRWLRSKDSGLLRALSRPSDPKEPDEASGCHL